MTSANYRRQASERWLSRHSSSKTDSPYDTTCNDPGRGSTRSRSTLLDSETPSQSRFAHGAHDWAQPRLTAREAALLQCLNWVTDQPGWQAAIGHDADVISLRPQPSTAPLIGDATWAWCVAELRDKEMQYRSDGFVSVFDSASCVVKSDKLISRKLLNQLQPRIQALKRGAGQERNHDDLQATRTLVEEQNAKFDWSAFRIPPPDPMDSGMFMQQFLSSISSSGGAGGHSSGLAENSEGVPTQPQSVRPVQLIDPNCCPLVFGRTRILPIGDKVSNRDACKGIGQGELLQEQPWGDLLDVPQLLARQIKMCTSTSHAAGWSRQRPETAKPYLYSHRVQWLPCEVSFYGDNTEDTKVKIASYINNLHPLFHNSLYQAIEQVISKTVKPWNEVLVRREAYQKPLRIRTYGVEWDPPLPDWALDLHIWEILRYGRGDLESIRLSLPLTLANAVELRADDFEDRYAGMKARVAQTLAQADWQPSKDAAEDFGDGDPELDQGSGLSYEMKIAHRAFRRSWKHPEPGAAYTYEQWRAGQADCAVIPPLFYRRDNMADGLEFRLPPQPVSLETEFQNSGLQVIVKLTSVELQPGQEASTGEEGYAWLNDGMLNEHVVATTIVCLSSVNIQPYSIALEVEADLDHGKFFYSWHEFEELEQIFGANFPNRLGRDDKWDPAMQQLGEVSLPAGRLLALPSVMRRHHKKPPALADATQPGQMHVLTLHLVDPHYRIYSTRDVPPQQHEWWASAAGLDRVLGQVRNGQGVPREVADQIWMEIDGWPMSESEIEKVKRMRAEDEIVYKAAVAHGVDTYKFDYD